MLLRAEKPGVVFSILGAASTHRRYQDADARLASLKCREEGIGRVFSVAIVCRIDLMAGNSAIELIADSR